MENILAAGDVAVLQRLLWPLHQEESEDSRRWYQQGFNFQREDGSFPFGLVQNQGGPCGVLAAVQAELLRLVLFVHAERNRNSISTASREQLLSQPLDETQQYALLTEALASLLFHCSGDSKATSEMRTIRVVVIDENGVGENSGRVYRETSVSVASYYEPALLSLVQRNLSVFRSSLGVIAFVFSVLRTKTVAAIRDEMDDSGATLTGQFGYCSQELLNLLLTGQAVSNVFDGEVPMGGDTGLMLHGIPQRARIGYLTQLEALRYCQVGSYYKSPLYPVWVIGSASHFSVCFGLDASVLSEESTSERLFQRIQRVFKSFDPMETGFMDIGVLSESLQQLGISREILSNEYWMARLLARLEVSGIVLWDEYWKVISVLLHTNDLELALSGKYTKAANRDTSNGALRPRSDSDIARELQAQFDAEERGESVVAAVEPPTSIHQPSATESTPDWIDFDLYYYNGLEKSGNRQPHLVKCHVKQKNTEEFIGQSVPISDSGVSGGHGSPPLEEIFKTKWPTAQIDWLGQSVPTID